MQMLADFTAGRESHPALKMLFIYIIRIGRNKLFVKSIINHYNDNIGRDMVEEMVSKTKREIARATRQLLKEKPINKITIKEITDRCELTRNAFYYHFDDIYDVINFIFENEVDNLFEEFMDEKDFEGGFNKGITLLYENRDMMVHIYKTHQHDIVNNYLGKIMHKMIFKMINAIDKDCRYSLTTRKVTAMFYRSAFVGVVEQWLTHEPVLAPEPVAALCDDIFIGTVIPALKASERALNSIDNKVL